ncbi:hypothetical protein J2X65_000897 [Ancylobacter sp. 3268]|uniref:DUF6538 domain-containing protein n=1 Tax=Ancylobacter sp. 3268 TaxID=2817752 RepID=UPI00285CC003|nr:DUF6538 domain-containing protein [Ancylobacter sp. 3268]MDR6951548.1 hypothetical protein [Ancylobacter sp. 3268]
MVKKPSSDNLYLQRLGTRWYARIPVPYALRGEVGPYFRKALGTADLQEARHRRWDVLALARAEFEKRAQRPGTKKKVRSTDYDAFRARLKAAGPPTVVNALDGEEMTNPGLDLLADELERAEEAGADVGAAWDAFGDHVHGREPISEVLKDYLQRNPKVSPTTVANYNGTVSLWIAERGDRALNGTTRKAATEWLEKVAEGKSRETISGT